MDIVHVMSVLDPVSLPEDDFAEYPVSVIEEDFYNEQDDFKNKEVCHRRL